MIHNSYLLCFPLYNTVGDSGVGQQQLNGTASKTLYNCQNLMKINVLYHFSTWKKTPVNFMVF